jgi:hypothetical protein
MVVAAELSAVAPGSPLTAGETENPLIRTAKLAAAALQRAKIGFVLGGGLAAYARGANLPEHDVDFLILEADAEAALEALADQGLQPVIPPEDWLVKAYHGKVLVDLIFRPVQRPVTEEFIDAAESMPFGGSHLPVLSATTLIVHKALSYGAHHCDFTDGLALARALREQVDWPRVAADVAASPYGFAFHTLLVRLGIAPPPEEKP